MSNETFTGLLVELRNGAHHAELRSIPITDLPAGEVLVEVAYSTLNYKDGLAVTGTGKILRSLPMIPGIDFSGTVRESQSPRFQPGDKVILTGWGVGERYWGGFGELARVKADWLVPLPAGLDLRQAMGIGTAGFTAMLAVMALEDHGLTRDRDLVVTGAVGGVGSIAVAILAHLGYPVVASTGRSAERDYLVSLGARDIIARSEMATPSNRPLEAERWGGAIDTVGGETLAGVIRSMAYHSSVAVCGLAGGSGLSTTVMPFILRGVNLLGIDSVMCPFARRVNAWERLAQDLPKDKLEAMVSLATLSDVPTLSAAIIKGRVRGRVVIAIKP